MDTSAVGKWLLVAAAVLAVAGLVTLAIGALGVGRLPGLTLGGRNVKVYVPIGLCILISVIGTIVLNVLFRGR